MLMEGCQEAWGLRVHGHTGGRRLCGMASEVHWGDFTVSHTNIDTQGLRWHLHLTNLFILASHNVSQLNPSSSSPQTDSSLLILWGSFKNQFDRKNQEAGLLGPSGQSGHGSCRMRIQISHRRNRSQAWGGSSPDQLRSRAWDPAGARAGAVLQLY